MNRAKIHHTIAFFLRRWHRRIGLAASFFVLWLVASGWALNHTETLGLAHIPIQQAWLLRWYGLKGNVPETGFLSNGHWLITNAEVTLLDGTPVPVHLPHPVGIAGTRDLLFVADETSITILTSDKRIVEELRGSQLPVEKIRRIGVSNNRVVIDGKSLFATRDGVEWVRFSDLVNWTEPQAIPHEMRLSAAAFMQGNLPLERVLLDFHSGRVLGRFGPYFIDLIGLLFSLLAISGVWMYARRQGRHKANESVEEPRKSTQPSQTEA
jgi:hypothetical protein